MAGKSQDLQDRSAHRQPLPEPAARDQAPAQDHESPAEAARRAGDAPGRLTPKQVVALQRTVGNRAVQRHVVGDVRDMVSASAEQVRQGSYRDRPEEALTLLASCVRELALNTEEITGSRAAAPESGPEGG
jgi:hypothetical protein